MKLTKTFTILALLLVATFAGCKKDPDAILNPTPVVSSTDPVNDATNIAINSKIAATFSVAMDVATITSTTFTLQQGTTAVLGTVTYSGTTATFTPTENLDGNAVFTAKISSAAKSTFGVALVQDYSWSFTTGETPDIILPTVELTDPLNEALDVALDKAIVFTLSEPMNPTTIYDATFTLTEGSNAVAGTISFSGNTVTLTPSSNLLYNKIYTATIKSGVEDMAGNAMAVDYTITFTTVQESIVPTILSTIPANNATNIERNKVIEINFSEEMNASTINAVSFMLMNGSTVVPGAISYSESTATFTPTNLLDAGTMYTVIVTTAAMDLAGNALAIGYSISFTTALETILPTIVSTIPLNNSTNVELNKVIEVTFSEEMNASTLNDLSFKLMKGTTNVPGTITYLATTAKFTPTNLLESNTNYIATVTTAVQDLAGNALATNTSWTFTTLNSAPIQAKVNLGSAGDYVILAKTSINNNSTSAITGDLGLSPAATSYITGLSLTDFTGYATSAQITGKVFAADMADPTPINLTTAVGDMITAYNDAAGRSFPNFSELGTGNIGGKTLMPGLYKWTNTVTLPSDITISGDADDVWIFQISGDLTVSSAVNITLIGGANASNIYWQVAGQVTVGTTSHFEGNILSKTAITFQTGSSLNGCALAQSSVILDNSIIVKK